MHQQFVQSYSLKFPDSSRWTPVKILSDLTTSSSKKEEKDDRIHSDPVTPLGNSAGNTKRHNNVVFNALDMIQNEIFYREEERDIGLTIQGAGLIQKSLVYLIGDDYYDFSSKRNKKTEMSLGDTNSASSQ